MKLSLTQADLDKLPEATDKLAFKGKDDMVVVTDSLGVRWLLGCIGDTLHKRRLSTQIVSPLAPTTRSAANDE